PLFEDGCTAAIWETERLELAAHALLRIARSCTEDPAAVRELVERGPLEREVERVAGRRDHARRAEFHPACALGDRREERDRLVARLREQAVPDPDGVEPGRFHDLRE